ncbi:MAG TPA: hypothetical protein VJ063_14020 [Verrucomicrobiae bacterium]|nr:hypothetical protein [Verrucomicrobiae bacterium]
MGSEIKCQIHLQKRKWYVAWIVKVWVWEDWKAQTLSLTTKFYDGDRRLIDAFTRSETLSDVSRIKHHMLKFVGGPPAAEPNFQGVQSNGGGHAEVWRFVNVLFPADPNSSGAEKVEDVRGSGLCTGKGRQPQ